MIKTPTGRWPSEPNMQPVPVRTVMGSRVRAALVAHIGEPTPVDYGAAEARIAAWSGV